jgi:hypothetical protein
MKAAKGAARKKVTSQRAHKRRKTNAQENAIRETLSAAREEVATSRASFNEPSAPLGQESRGWLDDLDDFLEVHAPHLTRAQFFGPPRSLHGPASPAPPPQRAPPARPPHDQTVAPAAAAADQATPELLAHLPLAPAQPAHQPQPATPAPEPRRWMTDEALQERRRSFMKIFEPPNVYELGFFGLSTQESCDTVSKALALRFGKTRFALVSDATTTTLDTLTFTETTSRIVGSFVSVDFMMRVMGRLQYAANSNAHDVLRAALAGDAFFFIDRRENETGTGASTNKGIEKFTRLLATRDLSFFFIPDVDCTVTPANNQPFTFKSGFLYGPIMPYKPSDSSSSNNDNACGVHGRDLWRSVDESVSRTWSVFVRMVPRNFNSKDSHVPQQLQYCSEPEDSLRFYLLKNLKVSLKRV